MSSTEPVDRRADGDDGLPHRAKGLEGVALGRPQMNAVLAGVIAGSLELAATGCYDVLLGTRMGQPSAASQQRLLELRYDVQRPFANPARCAIRFVVYDTMQMVMQRDFSGGSAFFTSGISGALGGWLEMRMATVLRMLPATYVTPVGDGPAAQSYAKMLRPTLAHCSSMFLAFGVYGSGMQYLERHELQPGVVFSTMVASVGGAVSAFFVGLGRSRLMPPASILQGLAAMPRGAVSFGTLMGIRALVLSLLNTDTHSE